MSKLLVDEISDADNTGPVTVTDGAVVNRQTTDGTIIDLRKNGTTVGSIGTNSNEYYHGSAVGADTFLRHGWGSIVPATSSGANRDAAIELGSSVSRFKDLYLSSGVYLGGTGAANHLDDYEEGTWTPSFAGLTIGNGTLSGQYTKIGRQVTLLFGFKCGSTTSVGTLGDITGGPFVRMATPEGYVKVNGTIFDSGARWYSAVAALGGTTATIVVPCIPNYDSAITASSPMTWTTNDSVVFSVTYETT